MDRGAQGASRQGEGVHPARDQLSAERRALPWVKVEKNYVFDTPDGKKRLGDLFAGRSQLIVYHFMLGPDWEEGCPSCSYLADHFDGAALHLSQRDVTFTAVSRAPPARDRSLQEAHGLALPVGVVLRQRLQLRLPRVVQAEERRRQGRIQLRMGEFRVRRDAWRERVLSRTRPAPSFTPIRPMRAVSTSWSALTIFSTSCPKAATRPSCLGPWRGCGAMTNMTTPNQVRAAARTSTTDAA